MVQLVDNNLKYIIMNKFVTLNEAMAGDIPVNFINSVVNDLKIKMNNIKGFNLEFDENNDFVGIKVCVTPERKKQEFDCLDLLKKCGFTDEQIKSITFKYTENGNVICDIKDGVDMTKSQVKPMENIPDDSIPKSVLDDAIIKESRNLYSVPIKRGGEVVDRTTIKFAYKGVSGKYHSGVTDKDLVEMLMNRWKDKNSEISDMFKDIFELF